VAGGLRTWWRSLPVERSTQIAELLDDAVRDGLELEDVSLRRANLESVFLHLTGRELRDWFSPLFFAQSFYQ
jgi:hypothetical protein